MIKIHWTPTLKEIDKTLKAESFLRRNISSITLVSQEGKQIDLLKIDSVKESDYLLFIVGAVGLFMGLASNKIYQEYVRSVTLTVSKNTELLFDKESKLLPKYKDCYLILTPKGLPPIKSSVENLLQAIFLFAHISIN